MPDHTQPTQNFQFLLFLSDSLHNKDLDEQLNLSDVY